MEARHKLVMSYREEYMGVSRATRGKILDTLEQSTTYDRKYLTRLTPTHFRN